MTPPHLRNSTGPDNPYREAVLANQAIVSRALARVDSNECEAGTTRRRPHTIIEHRTGAGVTRRIYPISPITRW